MTAAAEYADERAFEAYLAGRVVPAEGADLAAFAGAVRATAIEPGRPNAALAELLTSGLLVDQPASSARTTQRRRRPMWFFSALLAKIASAGAVAQAATGAGIVLVGFTGIGAAGALPAPVQHSFATVVAAITPLTPPDGTSADETSTDPVTTDPATPSSDPAAPTGDQAAPSSGTADQTGTTDGTDGAVAGAPAAPSAPKNFGQQVSSLAHERNAARKAAHDAAHRSAERTATRTESPDGSDSSDGGDSSDGSGSSDGSSSDGSGGGQSGHGGN